MTKFVNIGALEELPHDLDQYLSGIEREILLETLTATRWNSTRAARELGIPFRALRYRLERLGIEENGSGQRKLPPGFQIAWPRLREAAFKVYGRKCRSCGALAHHGAKLHVDHVKPLSRFPELALDLSNLQVLCDKCNLAKGNR